jgi:sulfane dehydrogenase subunit SoxC
MNDSKRRTSGLDSLPLVAGNGLLDRRALLSRGIAIAGATAAGASLTGAAAEPLKDDP